MTEVVLSGTAVSANRDNQLEKCLFDAIIWRQQSIANKEILTLIFVMMVNNKNQEIVGKSSVTSF